MNKDHEALAEQVGGCIFIAAVVLFVILALCLIFAVWLGAMGVIFMIWLGVFALGYMVASALGCPWWVSIGTGLAFTFLFSTATASMASAARDE